MKKATSQVKPEFAQFQAIGLRSIESNERLMEQEINFQKKKLQIDSIDFFKDGDIDWIVVQDILHLKSDSLLIHCLTKINKRIILMADERGQTLLHYAASLENYEAIHSLVKFARDKQHELPQDIEEWINSKTSLKSFTPLMYAASQGHFKTIQALIDHAADYHYQTPSGLTVLHVAAQSDAAKSIIIFVSEKGMNIDAQDRFGFTPLHWAVQSSKEMSLSYLISMNANPNI